MDFDSTVLQAEAAPENPKENVEDGSSAVQEIMKLIPEEKREKAMSALTVIRQESFAGPIPPPQVLKGYEDVLPGSADRILKMAENQQQHRIEIEKKAISSQAENSKRGQIFAFIVFILCVIVGLVFAYLDMKTFAGVFLTTTMVILVGFFIGTKVKIHSNLKEKAKDQEQ